MSGRTIFLGLVGLGLYVYMSSSQGDAAPAQVAQACLSADAVSVTLLWPAVDAAASETWIDLALNDAFIPGEFQSRGPFPPYVQTATLDALPLELKLYYRLNTRIGDEWKPTPSGSFTTECSAAAP